MKLLVIYNPHAGHGRAEKMLPQVRALFEQKGCDLDIRLTDGPGHATKLVREADFSQYDGVVAGGGDGTLFEVVNGYFLNPSEKPIPFGVLPAGTGNSFALDLGLNSSKWEEAVEMIARNRPRKVDVGRFTTEGAVYYYLNILGLGFVSDAGKTASKLKHLGNVSYLLAVLYRTIFLKTHKLTIVIDGTTLERENIFVEISNSRYTGGLLMMAPTAELDDGLLDVTLLGKCTRRKLLRSLPTLYTGEHVHLDAIETFKAKSTRISTDVPKILTPDGEILGTTPVEVECLHQAVEVFGR